MNDHQSGTNQRYRYIRALPIPPILAKPIDQSSFIEHLQTPTLEHPHSSAPFSDPCDCNAISTRPLIDHNPSAVDSETPQETYSYSYTLTVGHALVEFTITVEPLLENPGHHTLNLTIKADAVERSLCEPVIMRLTVDPSELDFSVFIFPAKASTPPGCLHSLRVWLRVHDVNHRIFADDDLWVAKSPAFDAINNASFAYLKSLTSDTQVYQGFIGGVNVNFLVRWNRLQGRLYNLTLEYEAGGAGRNLLDYLPVRLGCDPNTIKFMLYSLPVPSVPANASHKLRLWICSVPYSLAASSPGEVPYICQRIWKSDSFKLGKDLDFRAISTSTAIAMRSGPCVRSPAGSSLMSTVEKSLAQSRRGSKMPLVGEKDKPRGM